MDFISKDLLNVRQCLTWLLGQWIHLSFDGKLLRGSGKKDDRKEKVVYLQGAIDWVQNTKH